MLQVQALSDPAQFDVRIRVQQLQSDLFAAVAQRVVNLAETTSLDRAFDRVAIERL